MKRNLIDTVLRNRHVGREQKASRTAILNTQWGNARWFKHDFENFAKETYMKNVIAFKCMFMIAQSVGSVEWGIFTQNNEGEIDQLYDTPYNALIKRPNPDESWTYLLMKSMVYLMVGGETFVERIAPEGGSNRGVPKELYALRPDKMEIKLNDQGQIDQYVFDEKVPYDVDPMTHNADVLQLKLFNPLDDFRGLAITESAAREIDSANEATEWQKKLLENEARPGMIFSYSGTLTDEQFDRLEDQLKERHSGSASAGKNLILETGFDGGVNVQSYNWSPKELDFIESNRELARRICLAYGVPPMLLGIPGDNTYANMKEARLGFWEDTILFYLNYIKGEFNNWMFTDKPYYLDYNLDKVPAMASKREIMWERAQSSDFLTINEKRAMVGKSAYEGGDVILVPLNMIPLSMSGDLNINDNNDNSNSNNDTSKSIDALMALGYSREDAEKALGLL